MNFRKTSFKYLASVLAMGTIAIGISSCGNSGSSEGSAKTDPEVTIHELSDCDMLNPINYTDASAGYTLKNLFQSLMDIDFKTLELVPVLAKSRPTVEETADGGLRITYEIRDEAVWDNGTPITADDVEFTLKVIKNPRVDNPQNKPYYEFITDFVKYPDNPKKFTLVCNTVYILAEASSGDYGVLPKHFYDPNGLMDSFSIKDLTLNNDSYLDDAKIQEFANDFNSEKRQREKEYINGSGAYSLEEFSTGQRIVLVKKENWWGDQMGAINPYFEANAPKIIYQTINDQTSALTALKAEKLDVMRSIKSKDFAALPESEKYNANFNSHTPMMLAYTYIGINTRKPMFADKKVRQAFAHLVDVDKQIKTIKYGQAQRTVGPIHPSNKKEYNSSLSYYDYNPEKAKQLLTEAGWSDSNGDGTLDKEIDGQKVEMSFTFSYNTGNDERKATALLFQEEARKVGVQVEVITQEWSVYLDKQKHHEFDMFFGAWISTPVPSDHKQIYHSESYNGGSNYVGFDKADALIDSIRVTLDENKRAAMNKRFQAILHEEVPYIYLYTPTERIAIHKRFDNAYTSVMRPGYWEASFSVGQKALAEN